MKYGISAAPLPSAFPYKTIIERVCGSDFYPCLVGAIKMNETGLGAGPASENDISGDGGHGLMQLTSSYPTNWQDPTANIAYAVEHFLKPALQHWRAEVQGDDLVRCIAATYNAGLGAAEAGHVFGDVDKYTTDHYAARALQHYHNLLKGDIA